MLGLIRFKPVNAFLLGFRTSLMVKSIVVHFGHANRVNPDNYPENSRVQSCRRIGVGTQTHSWQRSRAG